MTPARRCKRCKQIPPRADGIPCSACAPGDTSPEAARARHLSDLAMVRSAIDERRARIAYQLGHWQDKS